MGRVTAIAAVFHIDPVAVVNSSWFEWDVRNAALELYQEAQPPAPPSPPR